MCATPASINLSPKPAAAQTEIPGSKGVWKKLAPAVFCEILSYSTEEEMDAISRTDRKWRDLTLNAANQKIACNSFLRAQTAITEIQQLQTTLFSQFDQKLSIPEIIIKCPNLKTLDLSDLDIDDAQFAVIAKACPASLENLYLGNNRQLQNLDFSPLGNLQKLDLSGCLRLQDPDFRPLGNLRVLNLIGCSGLQNPDFSPLGNLEKLYLFGCSRLQNPNFSSLGNLQKLDLIICSENVRTRVFTPEEIPAACEITREPENFLENFLKNRK